MGRADTRLWRTPRPPWSCTSWSRWTGSSAWPRIPQKTSSCRALVTRGGRGRPARRRDGAGGRRTALPAPRLWQLDRWGEGGPAPDVRAPETSPQASCSVSGHVSHGRRTPPRPHPAPYRLPLEWCSPRGQGALPVRLPDVHGQGVLGSVASHAACAGRPQAPSSSPSVPTPFAAPSHSASWVTRTCPVAYLSPHPVLASPVLPSPSPRGAGPAEVWSSGAERLG